MNDTIENAALADVPPPSTGSSLSEQDAENLLLLQDCHYFGEHANVSKEAAQRLHDLGYIQMGPGHEACGDIEAAEYTFSLTDKGEEYQEQ